MKPKERKYNRTERREMSRMNEKFDELIDQYTETAAKYGESDLLIGLKYNLDSQWRVFCKKHNSQLKSRMKADVEAFIRQIRAQEEIEKKVAEQVRAQYMTVSYDGWISKMKQYFPWTLRRIKFITYFKKSYVKDQWEKFQGKSPRGTWL